jgi:RimJ/RimL family protein N-acetyltransferase
LTGSTTESQEALVMQNAFLIGPTIYLRPIETEDGPTIAPWYNDQEVIRNTRQYRPMTRAREQDFLARGSNSETDLLLGIVPRATDRLIGCTGLHQMDFRSHHCSFGIVIGVKEEWGKGYGTEATRLMTEHAFRTLNFNRVWLHVHEFNERGIRAYEKVGYRKEGRLRQELYRDGRYWDTFVMGLLREEWATEDTPR